MKVIAPGVLFESIERKNRPVYRTPDKEVL